MYRVGLSSTGFALTEENFVKLHRSGIDLIEISMDEKEYQNINYGELKELSQKYNVGLWSYHLPFAPFETIDVSSTKKEVRENTISYFGELIKKGSDIGINKFVVHPSAEIWDNSNRLERLSTAMETLDKLAELAHKNGAIIAVETLPRDCLGNCSDEILKLISANDKLKVCLDTNHLLIEDKADFIKKVGNKITTLHVSDFDFVNERHWLPGEGKIEWQSVITALKEVGYSGPWLYEISLACPKTIFRDRELVFEDFIDNAKSLFNNEKPKLFCKHKEKLGMWE